MRKLLLDTDIGTNPDDALCLAYLLAQRECELLGITTVTGEVRRRAMLANAMCRLAGRDVPVYPGAEQPIEGQQRQARAELCAILPPTPQARSFPEGRATEFMRESVRRYPGEVTLLAIGPLTNVARLFEADPECAALLNGLVMMCGVFLPPGERAPRPDTNAALDPRAAARVYATPVREHRSIGLNVTQQVAMSREEARERFDTPLLRVVLAMAELWFRPGQPLVFHDPLAAATIFDERICAFVPCAVTVDLGGGPMCGMTAWRPGGTGAPHEVATRVDRTHFFEHYFSVARV